MTTAEATFTYFVLSKANTVLFKTASKSRAGGRERSQEARHSLTQAKHAPGEPSTILVRSGPPQGPVSFPHRAKVLGL
jgi:hypothetical protein